MTELVPKYELAKQLKISSRTLDRWHSLRKGPARVKVGNMVGYRPEAIEKWLLNNEIQPVNGGSQWK